MSCPIYGAGLGKNRDFIINYEGKIELQGGGPYTEDTFSYKLEAQVVGFKSLVIEGDFKLLCSTKNAFLTIPSTFSTDIISFLKAAPGT